MLIVYVYGLFRAQPLLLPVRLPKVTQDPKPKFQLQTMTIVDHYNYIGIGLGKLKSKIIQNQLGMADMVLDTDACLLLFLDQNSFNTDTCMTTERTTITML